MAGAFEHVAAGSESEGSRAALVSARRPARVPKTEGPTLDGQLHLGVLGSHDLVITMQ